MPCMAIVSKLSFSESSDLSPAGDWFESQLGHKVALQRLQNRHLNSGAMPVIRPQL